MSQEQQIDAHGAKAAGRDSAIRQGMRSRTVAASGEDYNEYLQLGAGATKPFQAACR